MEQIVNGKHRIGACVVHGPCRFTLLTERILRLEYDPEGVFEDRPSQTVLCRNLPVPDYTVRDSGERLEIDTKHYHVTYYYGKEEKLTAHSLVIDAKNAFTNYGGRWHFGATNYGDPPRDHNLMGTARTLDRVDGAIELERGLMDTAGRSFFDDSNTALFGEDGTLQSRHPGTVDVYYVCCQRDYAETLKDFFALAGRPPMLPRYALGNWWSRYYAYTAEEYLALMDRFRKEDLPFSIAVLDMDWHITEVDPKYGRGWTGHTWNRELISDPESFLEKLHDRDMHTMLNLHPADGVQAYEDQYPQMAAATGADPEKEEPVLFDMTDPAFKKAYFDLLMHPLEKMGVDHWWIDWQQGRACAVPNVDPLWLLNHYHYTDNCREGRRGLILSRYAGLGSHRYPAGFSGDTVVSWDSLDFQAYFTANAANAGFPFWSHDIGGFTGGIRDAELFVRWLQLGVFSPFMRLHCTRNPFASKEPWRFAAWAQPVIGKWLRLRHRMLPYIYTETYRQHTDGQMLVRPIYYEYPMENRAYSCRNQYLFGNQLMVCPVTASADEMTGMGSVKAWIPEGVWTDFFTGKSYTGSRVTVLSRPAEQYPVLARAGAIVPTACLAKGDNSTCNPEALEVLVFPGASGSYTMYEDDGISLQAEHAFRTEFTYDAENGIFTLRACGDASLVPEKRTYKVTFRGFAPFTPTGEQVESVSYDPENRSVTAILKPISAAATVTLNLLGAEKEQNADVLERVEAFLNLAKMPINEKRDIYDQLKKGRSPAQVLEALLAEGADRRLLEVLTELLTA